MQIDDPVDPVEAAAAAAKKAAADLFDLADAAVIADPADPNANKRVAKPGEPAGEYPQPEQKFGLLLLRGAEDGHVVPNQPVLPPGASIRYHQLGGNSLKVGLTLPATPEDQGQFLVGLSVHVVDPQTQTTTPLGATSVQHPLTAIANGQAILDNVRVDPHAFPAKIQLVALVADLTVNTQPGATAPLLPAAWQDTKIHTAPFYVGHVPTSQVISRSTTPWAHKIDPRISPLCRWQTAGSLLKNSDNYGDVVFTTNMRMKNPPDFDVQIDVECRSIAYCRCYASGLYEADSPRYATEGYSNFFRCVTSEELARIERGEITYEETAGWRPVQGAAFVQTVRTHFKHSGVTQREKCRLLLASLSSITGGRIGEESVDESECVEYRLKFTLGPLEEFGLITVYSNAFLIVPHRRYIPRVPKRREGDFKQAARNRPQQSPKEEDAARPKRPTGTRSSTGGAEQPPKKSSRARTAAGATPGTPGAGPSSPSPPPLLAIAAAAAAAQQQGQSPPNAMLTASSQLSSQFVAQLAASQLPSQLSSHLPPQLASHLSGASSSHSLPPQQQPHSTNLAAAAHVAMQHAQQHQQSLHHHQLPPSMGAHQQMTPHLAAQLGPQLTAQLVPQLLSPLTQLPPAPLQPLSTPLSVSSSLPPSQPQPQLIVPQGSAPLSPLPLNLSAGPFSSGSEPSL